MTRLTAIWLTTICLISLSASVACTTPRAVVVLPEDRILHPAYDDHGQAVDGYVTISAGYLREILQDLNACQQTPGR